MSPKPEKGRWLKQIPGICRSRAGSVQSEATNEFEGDLIKGTFSKLLWKSGIMKRGGKKPGGSRTLSPKKARGLELHLKDSVKILVGRL